MAPRNTLMPVMVVEACAAFCFQIVSLDTLNSLCRDMHLSLHFKELRDFSISQARNPEDVFTILAQCFWTK